MSAREDREAEEIAAKFRAAGMHAQADDYLRGHYDGRSTWEADRHQSAARFAVEQVRAALDGDDVELSRDLGLFRPVRRAEALATLGQDEGEAVGPEGVLNLSPGDPRLPPAWTVIHVEVPWYRHQLSPEYELKTILNAHISIFEGFNDGRTRCEYVSAVRGLHAGGCTCGSRGGEIGPGCCTGQSSGWVLDLWRERQLILVWRACSGCLTWARENGPAVGGDSGANVRDSDGQHAKSIDQYNAHKAKNAIAETENKLKEMWAHHPDWKRGDDGHWYPPEKTDGAE